MITALKQHRGMDTGDGKSVARNFSGRETKP